MKNYLHFTIRYAGATRIDVVIHRKPKRLLDPATAGRKGHVVIITFERFP